MHNLQLLRNLSGDLLVDPVWEAILRLERQDIRVLALTCDGASANQRLWKLHSKGRDTSERGSYTRYPTFMPQTNLVSYTLHLTLLI